ncbi:MAG: hypothetical protein KF723_11670 [Rhizobiaceae bacterium]|nr:hypothetical protein [Rhizobiaceae bacterium]
MTVQSVLVILVFGAIVGLIVRGFWRSTTKVKALEQPDNWDRYANGD